ncbi:unnamed protein product [Symbiodinium necroappetens]|uniref:Uncharacterized protein n=1 Tax=Symbiodinium necroappetens TaxID=1628268 RepID=A0A813CB34_9DINO|nr:unnamed protein product [Symbiodinium necroappetens]
MSMSMTMMSSFVQELGIPFRCLSTSETCKAYRAYQAANFEIGCQYESVQAQIAAHKRVKSEGESEDVDLLVIGTPCAPFSCMRGKRFHKESVNQHAAYDLTFRHIYEAAQTFEPAALVMEQSAGFQLKVHSETTETPLNTFLDGFKALPFQKGGYWIIKLDMDMSIWANISRSRPANSQSAR